MVTSVRSEEKAAAIKKAHPNLSKDKLDFAIVKDIAVEGAFDAAVVSDPPFEVVIHTASPFHFNITDVKKDLLDPATLGTTGVLKAIKKGAPSVKRVVRSLPMGINVDQDTISQCLGHHKLFCSNYQSWKRPSSGTRVFGKRLEPYNIRRSDSESVIGILC